LGSDDFIALYDTDLRLITHYPSPSNIQVPTGDNSQLSQSLTAALKTNPNVGIYVATSIDAISRTHSYRRNPKYGFIINVGVANKSALAEWRKQVWIIAALVSLFVISLLLFSRLIKQSWLSQEHDMELLKINQQALYDAQRLAKLGNYSYDISHDLWTSSAILDDIFGIPLDYLRDTAHWLALVVPESRQSMADYLKFIIEQHLAFDCEYRISAFEQWQPHLIWMDMRMPVMDGYQATANIRQLNGGKAVKIIALTASAFIDQHDNIINAGCDAVLHKPFHIPEIFTALANLLGVNFIYEDILESVSSPVVEITAEMLTTLPIALRQQLHEAALNLDIEETDAVLAQIRLIAPAIADGLQQLAAHYQFDQIIDLVATAD